MSLEQLFVGDIPCWHRRIENKDNAFCKVRKRVGRTDICPICRKPVTEGVLCLFLNNWKLFPNVICHGDCVDSMGAQAAAEFLSGDYAKAKAAVEGAKPWFGSMMAGSK
jgi:hypothetical protein